MKIVVTTVALTMALAVTGAHAQAPLSSGVAKADKNKDGKVSVDEWIAERSGSSKKIDTNKDKVLSRDEVSAYYAKAGGGTADPKFADRVSNMMKADTNADDKITADELVTRIKADFAKRDKNADGFITAAD